MVRHGGQCFGQTVLIADAQVVDARQGVLQPGAVEGPDAVVGPEEPEDQEVP